MKAAHHEAINWSHRHYRVVIASGAIMAIKQLRSSVGPSIFTRLCIISRQALRSTELTPLSVLHRLPIFPCFCDHICPFGRKSACIRPRWPPHARVSQFACPPACPFVTKNLSVYITIGLSQCLQQGSLPVSSCIPPPPCENNTELPKCDGNNTSWSDKGGY